MTENFEFPQAAEMCLMATTIHKAMMEAASVEELQRRIAYERQVQSRLDKAIPFAAEKIRKAAEAGSTDVEVYAVCVDPMNEGVADDVIARLNRFLIDRGYKTSINEGVSFDEVNIKVILVS